MLVVVCIWIRGRRGRLHQLHFENILTALYLMLFFTETIDAQPHRPYLP